MQLQDTSQLFTIKIIIKSLFIFCFSFIISSVFTQSLSLSPSPYRPLHVIEFGAGKGACAEYFLKYLAQNEPQLYTTVKYECVEIIERFANHLKDFLIPRHGSRVVVHHKDCLLWNQLYEDECFIIALEVNKRILFLVENKQMKLISRSLSLMKCSS
jgi:hypothetical protein